MTAKKVELQTTRFTIEPGDATRYQFSITRLPQRAGGVVTGIGHDSECVTLTIHNQPSGSYEVFKVSLRNPNKGFIQYLRSPGHGFQHVHAYTVAAIVLAAGVLVDGGTLESAANAMLGASELL